jgi:hypothetical protein
MKEKLIKALLTVTVVQYHAAGMKLDCWLDEVFYPPSYVYSYSAKLYACVSSNNMICLLGRDIQDRETQYLRCKVNEVKP